MSWRDPPIPVSEEEISEQFESDILVVGLGYSGTAALRSAAEAGADVIGIEVRSEKACTMFGGQIGHINSEFLLSHGVPRVDELELLNDWQLRSGNRSDPKQVRQYAAHSGKVFDWLLEPVERENIQKIHIRHWPEPEHHPSDISGMKTWIGTACFHSDYGYSATELMRDNRERAVNEGARVFFSTRALYPELEGKRVRAIIAETSGGRKIRFTVRKATILAAGDYSGNEDMVHELCVEMTSLAQPNERIRGLGRDGSGIRIGMWAGGRLVPQPMAHMGGNYIYPNGVIGNIANIWLDDTGRRFCNEGFGDMTLSALAGTRLPEGSIITSVFDDTVIDQMSFQQIGHCAMDTKSEKDIHQLRAYMDAAYKAGDEGVEIRAGGFSGCGRSNKTRLFAADSIEMLAQRIALSQEAKINMADEVRRYNRFCRDGRDEDFGKDARILLPMEKAPFFAFQKESYVGNEFLCTVDGLWTESSMHVLGADKRPLPGLYAVGTNGGRLFGVQYSTPISGVFIGAAVTFGYLAGKTAADNNYLDD